MHETKSNLPAAADDAVFPSDGNLYPLLIATHLNVDSNCKTLHSSNISYSPFIALASYQQRVEGGVSTAENVPGC